MSQAYRTPGGGVGQKLFKAPFVLPLLGNRNGRRISDT